ncbi:hypothetical protein NliqN6_2893 [Naganishia liquefaciens]|uniref:Proteasome maturation factor UMP1 n=1 Tax=Naganishia liquefaciens TaxID=104408 RepID=A0A8H3TS82_9TREE|nr:hypothetical protein NliqN6_2893 [Naganishia liquefaciens]
MSMRIVPATAPSASTSHSITYESTAHPLNAVHDALRHGVSKSSASVQQGTTHALQARLEQWAETQEKLKLGMQRSNFGLGLPLRVMMEKKIVMEDNHFPSLTASQLPLGGSTNIALEILNGTDEQLEVQDIMGTPALGSGIAPAAGIDIHAAMERKHRM